MLRAVADAETVFCRLTMNAAIQHFLQPELKQELELLLENRERAARKRSLGITRFIGELFKIKVSY